jgi:hypothetical protein
LLVVAVIGFFFFMVGELLRLSHAMNYHTIPSVEVIKSRYRFYDPTLMSLRHSAMAKEYRATYERVDSIRFLFTVALGTLILMGLFGRVVYCFRPVEDRASAD